MLCVSECMLKGLMVISTSLYKLLGLEASLMNIPLFLFYSVWRTKLITCYLVSK